MHGLSIGSDEDDKLVYIDLWKFYATETILPWKERLRWCWEILKSGEPYVGEVVLTPDAAKEFAEQIIDMSESLGLEQQDEVKKCAGFAGTTRPVTPERPS